MEKRIETIEPATGRTPGRRVIMTLGIIVGILVVVLGVVLFRNLTLISELEDEKDELTAQISTLRDDYAALSSDYDSINAQLDSSREEVNLLIERIKKTEATNRSKIRQYQKELGTLRSIMKSYIVQIDSLNTLNKALKKDAADARREAASAKAHNEELQKTVDDLSGKVELGSVIRGRNVSAKAYNKNGKVVDRCARTSYILVSLSLAENSLAPHGSLRVYVSIKDPDGNLLTNSESAALVRGEETIPASASREVDYQGDEVELGIYLNGIAKYVKGVYEITVMTEQSDLGKTQLLLR